MIAGNLKQILGELPPQVKLVVVSKTRNDTEIMEAYNSGHRIFGENRVQELTEKHPALPGNIEWHFIGHLQTNKVRDIAPFVTWIHAVDSFRLLREINKRAAQNNRVINCLLQFHIAQEESKHGFATSSPEFLDKEDLSQLANVKICGVMGMATFTDDELQVRSEFRRLWQIFAGLKEVHFADQPDFREISMGMSGDYQIAVEEGSTMVRIGSSIFGPREQ